MPVIVAALSFPAKRTGVVEANSTHTGCSGSAPSCYSSAVSFIKRLFSSDRRAALRAEATGDFELAAERYALAGEASAVVRMHLARADRAKSRSLEIRALRDALYWAREDDDLLMQARPALALALLAQCEAEGIKTERDKERVREAAQLFRESKRFGKAGDAYALISDTRAAVEAYRAGGLVAKLELALNLEEDERERSRAERNDYADYEMHMRSGERDQALACIRECIEVATSSSEYRRKLDELETRLITSGNVQLRDRRGAMMTLTAASEIHLGRDPMCDLSLRSGGISRHHAIVTQSGEGEDASFALSDAGSRNGTRLAGMPLAGSLPLLETGVFQLGDQLEVHFEVDDGHLHLHVDTGLDSGTTLWATREAHDIALQPLGIGALLQFRNGRPFVRQPRGKIELNDEPIALGEVQLIHGDVLVIEGIEVEVI